MLILLPWSINQAGELMEDVRQVLEVEEGKEGCVIEALFLHIRISLYLRNWKIGSSSIHSGP